MTYMLTLTVQSCQILSTIMPSTAGVPKPWAMVLVHGLLELVYIAGDEWQARQRSFIYIYRCSPSLELHLLSDQWWL